MAGQCMMHGMERRDPLLPAQLLGMVAVVGMETLAQTRLPAVTPVLTRAAAWGIVAGLLLLWVWVVPKRIALLHAGEDQRADALIQHVLWVGNLGTVGQIFLLFPWLSSPMQLLVMMFCLGTVAVLAFTAVERPPATGRPALMLLVIPAGLVAWHVIHPVPLRGPVIFVTLVFAALFWQLRAVVQRLVERTHTAMLDADAARAEAVAAREAKTRFLAAAWHDLGQPMQAARLYVDQALRSPDAQRRAHAARGAQAAFASVETQLRAMLEHLRLESMDVVPACDTISLEPVLADVLAIAGPAAKAAGLTISADSCNLAVLADRALLVRLLLNLVDNSVRHSGGSQVSITATAAFGQIVVRVADNGCGITPADRDALFKDFRQGQRVAANGQFQPLGFGLGLASARRIAQLLEGTLELETGAGPGACFRLALPPG